MTIKKSFLSVLLTLTFVYSFAQKTAPPNWFNLDAKDNGVPGVSTEKAYNELLKGKTSKTVVVAVIDGGTEVNHEDLKTVIWVNPKEVAGNGIDDDKNGYVDDINGWSFIGGKDTNVVEDSYELTRVYASFKTKYENANPAALNAEEKKEYEMFNEAKQLFEEKYNESKKMFDIYNSFSQTINRVIKRFGTETPTPEQVKSMIPTTSVEAIALKTIEGLSKKKVPLSTVADQLQGAVDHYGKGLKYGYNTSFDPRVLVGDNYTNVDERYYGSNYVSGPKGEHGTHVAGIIGAVRNNNTGMNGVSDNVRIMVLRVVPDGDERDKDVANAIRYAADNGASVINMSFGKSFSPYKKAVDEAIKYAESKDVLMIHAAGNDSKNSDTTNNFPRDVYETGAESKTWIEVGASSWKTGKHITATFSNYGKTNVDVFAPGVDIYSCIPVSSYASYDGTSMASPVTAGVAALIRSYYPQFTAAQVKDIILTSAIPVKKKVIIPGEKKKKIKMTELCRTGAIVNAYTAIKLAEERSAKK